MTKKKDKDPIELTEGSLCKLVLIGPGEDTIVKEGIFKGYLDFMGNGLAFVMDSEAKEKASEKESDKDEKKGKSKPKKYDGPVHTIVPLSSIIYFEILVEAEKEDEDGDDKKKTQDRMYY